MDYATCSSHNSFSLSSSFLLTCFTVAAAEDENLDNSISPKKCSGIWWQGIGYRNYLLNWSPLQKQIMQLASVPCCFLSDLLNKFCIFLITTCCVRQEYLDYSTSPNKYSGIGDDKLRRENPIALYSLGGAIGSFPGSEMRRQHSGEFSEEVDWVSSLGRDELGIKSNLDECTLSISNKPVG